MNASQALEGGSIPLARSTKISPETGEIFVIYEQDRIKKEIFYYSRSFEINSETPA